MPSNTRRRRSGILMLLAVLGIVAAFMTFITFLDDPLVEGRKNVSLRECSKNLTKITRAIERYSADRDGQLPRNLRELTPDYLREFPRCSAAQQDTYSASYRIHHRTPQSDYSLYCRGSNHRHQEIPEDHPRRDRIRGPQLRP